MKQDILCLNLKLATFGDHNIHTLPEVVIIYKNHLFRLEDAMLIRQQPSNIYATEYRYNNVHISRDTGVVKYIVYLDNVHIPRDTGVVKYIVYLDNVHIPRDSGVVKYIVHLDNGFHYSWL